MKASEALKISYRIGRHEPDIKVDETAVLSNGEVAYIRGTTTIRYCTLEEVDEYVKGDDWQPLLPAVPIGELPKSTIGWDLADGVCGKEEYVRLSDLQSIVPTRPCDCEEKVRELGAENKVLRQRIGERCTCVFKDSKMIKMCHWHAVHMFGRTKSGDPVKPELDEPIGCSDEAYVDKLHTELATLRAQLAGKWVLGEPMSQGELNRHTGYVARYNKTTHAWCAYKWNPTDRPLSYADYYPWTPPTIAEPEVPAVPKRIAYGDEWAKYEYRGYVIFDTCCGQAGCYVGHSYYGRTLQEACSKIDKLMAALSESEATE